MKQIIGYAVALVIAFVLGTFMWYCMISLMPPIKVKLVPSYYSSKFPSKFE